MNRREALNLLARDQRRVPAGQPVSAALFTAADGPGVARLFYTVYGEGYPIDAYYIPERLVEENQRKNLCSVVARTASGDVVAHIALYRSSPGNPHLYEYGLGLTLPEYRSTTAFFLANRLLLTRVGHDGIDGFFGEAVCNHTTTQKLAPHAQAVECAIEPALMPAEAYQAEQSAAGRVGCLAFCRVVSDEHRLLYIPKAYHDPILSILATMTLDRQLLPATEDLPKEGGELQVSRFAHSGVARCHVLHPGQDLARQLSALEDSLKKEAYALIQLFVDLGKPWSGALTEMLRQQGYCFGGLLPIWFGSDALLMQKHSVDPDFQGLKILTARGRAIVELAQTDWLARVKEKEQG